jgi:hypothetical protein
MKNHDFELCECTASRHKTKLIMSNGSERGDYINCLSMQRQFASPHDGIQLMKTYYPSDPKWSEHGRISKIHPNSTATYAWDYSYDDYPPLILGDKCNSLNSQMEQVKSIGADVHLTLTLDMSLSDEELMRIFKSLADFGVVYLRINHEANGRWFRHHKLHSYQEVNDFFVRCHHLVKSGVPNIKTVFSLSADVFVGDQINSIVTKKLARIARSELQEALGIADYWSLDKYVTLNWGWPYTHPDTSDNFFAGSVDTWWRLIEETYLLMIHANGGVMKPLFLHEFNSDSDVVGGAEQAATITEVYQRIIQSDFPWLAGICFYQYSDEGGLGLWKGIDGEYSPTESLVAYSNMMRGYHPIITRSDQIWPHQQFSFCWTSADTVKGVSLRVPQMAGQFFNRFEFAVYWVQENNWTYVQTGESVRVLMTDAHIFIPPHKQRDKLRYVTTVQNIKEDISTMFLYR